MIIELRSLFPAREEERSRQSSGENRSEEKHEAKETPFVEVELRAADLPQASSPPENVSFSASVPARPPLFREDPFSGESEGSGGAFRDDRIPELLERLLAAAERSAALSEQIAGLMEQQSPASLPVYA